jgi:predicted O-linked N-acetylglucosamine transferase (SPINDLY family)
MGVDGYSANDTAADAARLLAEVRGLIHKAQWSQAAARLQDVPNQYPDHAELLRTLATVHLHNDSYLPALQTLDRLIGTGQANAVDYQNTGDALTAVGEDAQAVDAYRRSLERHASDPHTLHNFARVLYRLGLTDQAADHLKLCAQHCDAIDPWLSLATIAPGCCRVDHREVLRLRREFAARLAHHQMPWNATGQQRPAKRSATKIRIGYLSSFFHQSNYMKPVWGLINAHRRDEFEIHLFSDSPMEPAWPDYQAQSADRLHYIAELDNHALNALIRQQEIDVLIDLNAYSTTDRLGLFLSHPAPVTMAWFNMYATSGLPGFDYIIGDNYVVLPAERSYYSETVISLPVSYLTFTVNDDVPAVTAPPCKQSDGLTFGSLVSQYKITPRVLDAWAEILRRTRKSRLFLANATLKSKWNRAYVRDQFQQRGVAPERVSLAGPQNHRGFLKYYDRMDVALDAFPYNGGTTTMEAIWQGVPVLTFIGDRWASRTSYSLLANSPVRDFVAADCRGMIEQAVAMADDPKTPSRLDELRGRLRGRLAESVVCDTRAFCRQMETLYKKAHASLPVDSGP